MYGTKEQLDRLLGAKVNRLLVSEDKYYIVFDTDRGAIGCEAVGD